MTVKMKARDLGLADLRYDVEFVGRAVGDRTGGEERWVGTLVMVNGPSDHAQPMMQLVLAKGAEPARLLVEADSEVTVDRKASNPPTHFGVGF